MLSAYAGLVQLQPMRLNTCSFKSWPTYKLKADDVIPKPEFWQRQAQFPVPVKLIILNLKQSVVQHQEVAAPCTQGRKQGNNSTSSSIITGAFRLESDLVLLPEDSKQRE